LLEFTEHKAGREGIVKGVGTPLTYKECFQIKCFYPIESIKLIFSIAAAGVTFLKKVTKNCRWT